MSALATLCYRLPKTEVSNKALEVLSSTVIKHIKKTSRVDICYFFKAYQHIGDEALVRTLEERALELSNVLTPQDIVNILPILLNRYSASALFEHFDRKAGQLDCSPKELSLLLNIYSKTEFSGIFQKLEGKVTGLLSRFDSQQISMIVAAYGRSMPNSVIFRQLENRILSHELKDQALATVLYWYSKAGKKDSPIFSHYSEKLKNSSFSTQELVNLYTAYSIAHNSSTLEYLESQILRNLNQLTPQGIANCLDSAARSNRPQLCPSLCRTIRARKLINQLASPLVHLVMTVHSLAKFSSDLDIVQSLIDLVDPEKTPPDELAILICSCLKTQTAFKQELKEKLLFQARSCSPKQLVNFSYYLSKEETLEDSDWRTLVPCLEALRSAQESAENAQLLSIFRNLSAKLPEF